MGKVLVHSKWGLSTIHSGDGGIPHNQQLHKSSGGYRQNDAFSSVTM